MHYDLCDSVDDGSMRMLNAIEPRSVIPVHRLRGTSATKGDGSVWHHFQKCYHWGRFCLVAFWVVATLGDSCCTPLGVGFKMLGGVLIL